MKLSSQVSTRICNNKLIFDTCIYNASGAKCTDESELQELHSSNSGAVLTKSCTMVKRDGNPLPRYYGIQGFSINSMGLPNHGLNFYLDFAKQIDKKPYILSICGLYPAENIALLALAMQSVDVDAIELNVSCPNIIGKPQLGYDFEGLREFLGLVSLNYAQCCKYLSNEEYGKPVGLKLPPYFDFVHFEIVANIIKECNEMYPNRQTIQFITCSNSLGNGLWIDSDSETVVIKPKEGFGGIGGSAMKATTLANVHKFYQLIGDSVDVIGCGGVTCGKDVFDLILVGAKAVQVGTQLMENGTDVFDLYLSELSDIMNRKGYKSIEDFRGKLKYL
jgi:dihydroorotate dehydrogenase (fumarate)